MASSKTITTATIFIAATLLLFSIFSTYTPSLMQRPPRRSLQALAPQWSQLPSQSPSQAPFPHLRETNSSHNSTRRSHHRSQLPSRSPSQAPFPHLRETNSSRNSTRRSHHNVTKCPIDTINVGVCVDVLDSLVNVTVGFPARYPCCEIVDGLVDVEVAVCLCTTFTVDLFGVDLDVPIRLSVLVNFCGKIPPPNFQCPPAP